MFNSKPLTPNISETMKTETKETTDNRSEQQAIAQLESIVEMVQAMDKESVAREYAKKLSRETCVILLNEAGIECRDSENIGELMEAVAVNIGDGTLSPDDFEFDDEEAREAIQQDPLSVEVRSGWYAPGAPEDDRKPFEFTILLCTGGPACRLIGDLDEHIQPERVRIQHQDWGTPWTEYFPNEEQRAALLTYCQQFYFGE